MPGPSASLSTWYFSSFISELELIFFYQRDANKFPGVHFLDATTQEEAATPLRLILIFSCTAGSPVALHGMHLLGTAGDTDLTQIESLVKVSETSASIFFPT